MNRRKRRRVAGFLIVMLTMALVVTRLAYPSWFGFEEDGQPQPNRPSASIQDTTDVVGPTGKTVTAPSGIVVTVPPGAVTGDTQVAVSVPATQAKDDVGPFTGLREAGVMFDVTLIQGGKHVQPLQPLDITIPLAGSYRPSGAESFRPLLYTPGVDGKGFELVPATVNGGVLRASLAHLSPKYLTYISDAELLRSFYPEKAKQDRSKCPQEVTSGGKIRLVATGWSLDKNSAIFACLDTGEDGFVRVGVYNDINYILSVAATSDVRLVVAAGSADEEMVKTIANRLFGDPKVKGYAGNGDKIVGSVRVSDLPATIEMIASPSLFFAEAMWHILSLSVGLLTGKAKADETISLVAELMNDVGLVTCLQNVTKPLQGKAVSFGDVAGAGVGCMTNIVGALAKYVDIGALLNKAAWIVDALQAIIKTGESAMNGVKLAVNNTMRVQIERKLDLSGFTGDWYVHGSHLTVNADGSGNMTWNAGSCGDTMCTGHATLVFQPVNGSIRGKITSQWYERANGDRYTGSDAGRYEYRTTGKSFTLKKDGDYFLVDHWETGEQPINPFWCRSYTPVEQQDRCGA